MVGLTMKQVKYTIAYYLPCLLNFITKKSARRLKVSASRYFVDIVDDIRQQRLRLSRKNTVFILDMLNFFDYYYSSAKPFTQKIDKVIYKVVDFSTPRLHEIIGFDDFPILCPTLAEPFITTQQYMEFAALAEGDVVFDLGAYCGLTAISFSKAVGPTGQIIAIEPDPLNYPAAKANISRHEHINKLQNISLMNCAAGRSSKIIQFSSEGTMGSADISIVGRGRGDVVDVRCLPLSEIAEAHNLSRVDFVKMDIEGAEEDVLRGAEIFLKVFRPKLMVEPHIVQGVLSTDVVVKILHSYGYQVEIVPQFGVDLPLIQAVYTPL